MFAMYSAMASQNFDTATTQSDTTWYSNVLSKHRKQFIFLNAIILR